MRWFRNDVRTFLHFRSCCEKQLIGTATLNEICDSEISWKFAEESSTMIRPDKFSVWRFRIELCRHFNFSILTRTFGFFAVSALFLLWHWLYFPVTWEATKRSDSNKKEKKISFQSLQTQRLFSSESFATRNQKSIGEPLPPLHWEQPKIKSEMPWRRFVVVFLIKTECCDLNFELAFDFVSCRFCRRMLETGKVVNQSFYMGIWF